MPHSEVGLFPDSPLTVAPATLLPEPGPLTLLDDTSEAAVSSPVPSVLGLPTLQSSHDGAVGEPDAAALDLTGRAAIALALEPDGLLTGEDELLVIPGSPEDTVTLKFEWVEREAAYDNEVGFFLVEGSGAVDGVVPGAADYAFVALTDPSQQVIFASGETAGASQTFTLQGGDRLAFYLIQDASTETWLTNNRDNTLKKRPQAFFSFNAANPDEFDHLITQVSEEGVVQLAWEDLTGGGDRDFNDVVFRYEYLDTPPPSTTPTLQIDDLTITEGDTGTQVAEFTLQLSAVSSEPVTVDFTTVDGSALAGQDYSAVSGQVTFAPGEVTQTIRVAILSDTVDESDEAFTLELSNPVNAEIADGKATGTILDDDGLVAPGILLKEDTFFRVVHEQAVTIPTEPSVLQFTYADLNFDLADPEAINDAFEVALVDSEGNSLVHTVAGSRDAFFNITEGLEPLIAGAGVTVDGQKVTVNLAGITPGTEATLIFRLVNNDGDTESSVQITDIQVLAADVTLVGGVTPVAAALVPETSVDFAGLSDVSASLVADYGRTSFNEESDRLFAEFTIQNAGSYSVDGPIVVVVQLSDPTVQVLEADGVTPEGLPYYLVDELNGDGVLQPGDGTGQGTLVFGNPNGIQFTYDLVVLGHLNAAPEIVSEPNLEGLIGKPYRYDVDATDPEGDPVTYSLVVAPEGMTIDETTGEIEWAPQEADRGTQSITVRAADGRGGVTDQSFDLVVGDAPPNRPPVFTTGPVVDARVNTAYEYDADATDLDSDNLTYTLVDGPEGMSIDPVTGVVSWTPTAEQIAEENSSEAEPNFPTIPGFTIENYAEVIDPNGISFDEAGNLYVGRDQSGSGGSAGDPVRIHQISAGGKQVIEIGERVIDDPDAVLFDANGLVSGTPGAIIVGGGRNDGSGIGDISAVLPNGTVEILYSSTTLGNVSSLSLDQAGRLIFINQKVGNSDLVAIENGEVKVLASQQPRSVRLAIDNLQGNIYAAGLDGVIRVYDANGQLLDQSFADQLSDGATFPSIAWGTGGYWGNDLYVLDGAAANLYRFDRDGNKELIISGLPEGLRIFDIAFGPDNALYLSDFENDRILRIAPDRETLGLDPSEHPVTITVADGQGGVAVQNYVVNVLPEEGNHDPVIVSEPETTLTIPPDYQGKTWDFKEDFELVLPQIGNGEDNAWFYYRAEPGDNDGEYTLFDSAGPGIYSVSYAHWGPNRFHLVGKNSVVPGTFNFNNPASNPEPDSIVGFRAPTSATYSVSGLFKDKDGTDFAAPSDQRGVRVDITTTETPGVAGSDISISEFESALIDASNTNEWMRTELGNPEVLPDEAPFDFKIFLEEGQTLFFRVNDLGSNRFDSTQLEIEIGDIVTYEYDVDAIDPDDETLTYSLVEAPGGMEIDGDTGEISWLPTAEQINEINEFQVVVRSEDGRGGSDEQDFKIQIETSDNSVTSGEIRGTKFLDLDGDGDQDLEEQQELINLSSRAFYNSSLGDLYPGDLNSPFAAFFPGPNVSTGDPFANFPEAPDLSDVPNLGNWLSSPEDTIENSEFWTQVQPVPQRWKVNDETAIIYEIDAGEGSIVNLTGDFGVDNGIYIWLNGEYLFGAMRGGGAFPGEYNIGPVDLSPGKHYLQVLREDHGGATGYEVSVTGDGRIEPGLEDWTIYIDANNNDQRDADELFTTTDADGNYAFEDLTPGTYILREENQPGYIQTFPNDFKHIVTVDADEIVENIDFGNFESRTNAEPEFISTPAKTASANQLFRYDADAQDANGDLLTYDLSLAPDGMAVDPSSGIVVWNPTINQLGDHDVILRVQDGNGGVDLQAFQVTVSTNTAPEITSSPTVPAFFNLPYQYDVEAQDADGDVLTFQLETAPDEATIDPQTGVISFLPTISSRPATEFFDSTVLTSLKPDWKVEGFDDVAPGEDAISPETFADQGLTIVQRDDAPMNIVSITDKSYVSFNPSNLNSAPHGLSSSATPAGGVRGSGYRDFTDNYDFIFSENVYAAGLWIGNIGPGTTEVQFLASDDTVLAKEVFFEGHPNLIQSTPRYNNRVFYGIESDVPIARIRAVEPALDNDGIVFDDIQWYSESNAENFVVKASDPSGAFDTQSFSLPVVTPSINRPPLITNAPRGQIGLGQDYRFQIEAEDPDNDPITYSLTEFPEGMTIDQNGLVQWPGEQVQLGDYSFTVQVEDSRGAGTRATYTLTVGQQTVNNPPEITSTPSFVATIGDQYLYEPEATDPDNDPIVWSLVSGPQGLTLNESTGRVSWIPTEDQFGFHEVVIEAIDAQGASFQQGFGLNVSSTNVPPLITSAPPTVAFADTAYIYDLQASDPNSDALTYSLNVAPEGMTIDEATGQITWTPTADQLGTQTVTISVADGKGGFAEQTYTLNVASDAPNLPPQFTSQPSFSTTADQPYTYQLEAIDPENLTLRYQLLDGPSGMLVDETTGELIWTPTADQIGPYKVEVAAFDPLDLGAKQTFTLTVGDGNQQPVLNNQPDTTALVGQPYAFDLDVTDPDGDAVTYTLEAGPADMTLDALGRLRWTPEVGDEGNQRVELLVEDGRGGNFTFGYDLSVVADTTAPQVALTVSADPVDINDSVVVQVNAVDDVAIEEIGLTVDGTPVALDSNGSATLSFDAIGSVALVATALDTSGNATSTDFALSVVDTSDVTAPLVSFIRLEDPNDSGTALIDPITKRPFVTSFADIIGTVDDPDDNLVEFTLAATPFAGGPTTTLATGTSEVNGGVLGEFDPTLLRNDSYILELSAVDAGGNTASTSTLVDVEGDLKIGNYTLSFVDLSIPLTGIPIVVSRTYDTLNANVTDDFGYGWSMDLRDTDLTDNVGKSGLEDSGIYNAFFDGAAVYVTLPNGEREKFIFQPQGRGLFGLTTYKPRFVAADGDNTSTLTVDDIDLRRTADGRYVTLSQIPYNPASTLISSLNSGNYTLTTKDGIKYTIDANSGDLEKVTDRNGNTLTYTEAGVFSSTGKQVTFERDPQGRITAVIDPEGNRITYEYDALGDLVAVTDREGNTTRFDYEDDIPHFLEDVIDPLGRPGIRSEYQDGRLVKLFDFDGNEVELIHDPDNFVETVEDQFGNPTVYEYDSRGNVLTEIDVLGGITRRTYDSNDNMLTETVEKDGVVFESMTFTYDSRNNILSETDALGNTTYFTYDSFGNVLTTTDPSGQTVTNTYDAKGNLTQIEGQATGSLTLSYDSAGNLKSLTDSVGTTTFEYFPDGNIKSQKDALGTVTTYTYDNNGNQLTETTTQTTPDGVLTLVTTMEYDDEGRVVKVTDADGNFTETIYDANGNRIEEIDALRRSTKYIYDERGQLIETIYLDETPEDLTDNPRTRTEYDEAGRVIAEYDELGRATRMVYDELGRVTETIYADDTPEDLADNSRTKTEYDAAGRVTAQIDEQGNRTEFIYDEAGRLLETIYPDETPENLTDNPRFTTVYDDAGRQIRQTDALGQTTQFFYDELGRSVRQQYDDGTTSSVEYDDAGRVVAQTDQENKTTRFEYDDLGRLEAVVDALNQRTEYTYDEQGNLLTQKDANGNITRYEYDELGRRTATVLPEEQRSVTIYDALGNPIRTTDFNGDSIIYTYDERYRLATKDLPGEEFDEAYTYTDNGLLETVTDDRGVTRYEYDERNRLSQRQDPDGTTIAYSYDDAGNRTAVTIPSGTTDYTFDAQNRLKTVTDPDGGVTTYFYNAIGNLERTEFPNGTAEIREYDSLNRLIYIENNGPNGIINSFRYTLNNAGHRTAVDEHDGRRVEYTYDDLYRLTKETIYDPGANAPSRTIEYVYDEVGNRLSRDDSTEGETIYTYDNNDRLETATINGVATTYTYDDNGNTTSKTTNGTTITYDWNADNRLISADTDGDGTLDVANQYNQNGIRVSQTVNGEETRFLIDENRPYAQVLEEYTPDGIITVSYVYGNDLISQNREGISSFYHVDGLGSTRAITNLNGVTNSQYSYDAYGRISEKQGSTDSQYSYTGEQQDFSLNLGYLRARYYDPSTGRFISQDPFEGSIGSPVSLHNYLYANNNPVNAIDPSGLVTVTELAVTSAIVGGLSGAIIGGIGGGVEGAITGALSGALLGPIFSAGVLGAGAGLAYAAGISTASGVFLTSSAATAFSTALGIRSYARAQTDRERYASLAAIVLSVASLGIGARSFYNARAGRGTFINEDPQVSSGETAVGRFLANALRTDVVRKPPTSGARRGPQTADYRIGPFQGRTLELKTLLNSNRNTIAKEAQSAQGQHVAVVVPKGKFTPADFSRIAGRVFSPNNLSNSARDKQTIQIIFQDMANGSYELGPLLARAVPNYFLGGGFLPY